MDAHCQTATPSGSGEHQTLKTSTVVKTEKRGSQLQTENLISEATSKMHLF